MSYFKDASQGIQSSTTVLYYFIAMDSLIYPVHSLFSPAIVAHHSFLVNKISKIHTTPNIHCPVKQNFLADMGYSHEIR